jgi:glucokinase
MKDFILITLGTGLGSGIVAGGDLVYGADGFAGEIGHTIVDPRGRQCGCGRRGCLETYASAPGVCRTVLELLADRVDVSELRAIPASELTAKLIADAAGRGDVIAKAAYEKTGDILGFKLADSVAHTSPEAIILFGGVANAGDLIFKPTRRSLEHHLLNIFQNKVKVIPSSLKEAGAAVLGASALIWKELQKKK